FSSRRASPSKRAPITIAAFSPCAICGSNVFGSLDRCQVKLFPVPLVFSFSSQPPQNSGSRRRKHSNSAQARFPHIRSPPFSFLGQFYHALFLFAISRIKMSEKRYTFQETLRQKHACRAPGNMLQ